MTSQRTSGLPPVAAEGAIVVFGATGGVGRHAVEQLLGAGQEVIAVVRDPSKGTALAKAGARVVIHDLQHDDSGRLSPPGLDDAWWTSYYADAEHGPGL